LSRNVFPAPPVVDALYLHRRPDQPLFKDSQRYCCSDPYFPRAVLHGMTPCHCRHSAETGLRQLSTFPIFRCRDVDLGWNFHSAEVLGSIFMGILISRSTWFLWQSCNFFAGSNYVVMNLAADLGACLYPVVLFFFGKKFHSTVLASFCALVLIFRQRNAIVLASSFLFSQPSFL